MVEGSSRSDLRYFQRAKPCNEEFNVIKSSRFLKKLFRWLFLTKKIVGLTLAFWKVQMKPITELAKKGLALSFMVENRRENCQCNYTCSWPLKDPPETVNLRNRLWLRGMMEELLGHPQPSAKNCTRQIIKYLVRKQSNRESRKSGIDQYSIFLHYSEQKCCEQKYVPSTNLTAYWFTNRLENRFISRKTKSVEQEPIIWYGRSKMKAVKSW